MKLNKEFRLNYVDDEAMLVKAGGREADMSKVYSLSEPAAWLYSQIVGREVEEDELVRLLTSEYDVSEKVARKDIRNLVDEWRLYQIIL